MDANSEQSTADDSASSTLEFVVEQLRSRLERVAALTPCAAHKAGVSCEHVHRLRVATRRASVALRLFRDLLPRKRRSDLERTLHRMRRRAGAARDLDVLIRRLTALVPETPAIEVAELVAGVAVKRGDAQRGLRHIAARRRLKRFVDDSEQLLARVRWRGAGGEPDLQPFLRMLLGDLVTAFREAATDAPKNASDAAEWHRRRVAAKRLRYGLELLAGPLQAAQSAKLREQLIQIQDSLGEIHDRAVAQEFWAALLAEKPADVIVARVTQLIAAEAAAELAAIEAFAEQWPQSRWGELAEQAAALTIS